jgi:UDP-glucose 4-epimerase|tara:strand:- start:3690 stop:4574 length:885 start_codon:yes stop_codon:yes gene_type:complete
LKKIVITGHTGFIGQNLINELNKKKINITGISRTRLDNTNLNQIKRNIQDIKNSDIEKKSIIIHLAGMTNVLDCEKNPVECFKINVEGTQKILQIAKEKKCKVIFPSTSHVYGHPKKIPIDENQIVSATSIYSASKIAGEILCQGYSNTYKMDIGVFRLFSAYGPKNSDYKVESRIISQLLSKKKIKLGNLSPKRDFIYILDVVNAIKVIMRNLKKFEIYNIGTGKSNSIKELSSTLKKISGKNLPIETIKNYSRKTDIPNVICNNKKIRKLGWEPKISFFKGLEMTYESYKIK